MNDETQHKCKVALKNAKELKLEIRRLRALMYNDQQAPLSRPPAGPEN